MGTSYNRIAVAVLTSTHNLCFDKNQEKNVYPCIPHFYYIKGGSNGIPFSWICIPDSVNFSAIVFPDLFNMQKREPSRDE